MLSWKSINQQIRTNLPSMNIKDVKIRNLNPNFEQTTDLVSFYESYYPETEMDIMAAQMQKEQLELANKYQTKTQDVKPNKVKEPEQENNENSEPKTRAKLEFIPNQIMVLPSQLTNILPESDILYIYGVPRANSFLMAITLIVDKNFLFYDNKKKKDDHIRDQKIQLAMCLKDYFKEKNYRLLMVKRGDMENELMHENDLSDFNRWYIADYYKINIIVLNLIGKTYQLMSSWNSEYPVVIMIHENDVYLPILNNKGENIFKDEILKTIMMNFEEQQNPLVVMYDKKMNIKQKKQKQENDKFQDLSNYVEKKETIQESESESNSETESEPEIESEESDIEINVSYNVDDDEEPKEEKVKSKSKKASKKTSDKKSYTKSTVSKMKLNELKDIAKELNINLSKDSKQKKKQELLDEIIDNLDDK